MVLEGKKTYIGLIVTVLVGLTQAWGIELNPTLMDTVKNLALGLVGYGLYDKIGRNKK